MQSQRTMLKKEALEGGVGSLPDRKRQRKQNEG